jgi:hypothetical protein
MLTDLHLAVDPAEQMSTATSVQTVHVVRNALSALQDSFWWLSVRFMPTGFARYVVVIEVYVHLKKSHFDQIHSAQGLTLTFLLTSHYG